uniref:SUKH-4 immunity protein of toxin-antitoxin system n=1 Tax=Streptomyces sp. NBC_00008 TaxID=2903610 RepID=A0AAU2W3C0_9ACTN
MQPVLETRAPDGFDLWPVAEVEPAAFLPLSGGLSPAEVGAAMMCIAGCNDIDPEDDPENDRPPRPADPLGSFLHGLLTFDTLFAAGGLRVTDDSTGTTFLPGCCDGLEDWRAWHQLVDKDGALWFGHDPVSPVAERFGNTVRLTVDAEQGDSPVIEPSVTELRRLLAGAERDLASFLTLANSWTHQHLPPSHRAPVTAALARALCLPWPVVPSEQ